MPFRTAQTLLLAALLSGALVLPAALSPLVPLDIAWADDDDDGDDADDDDDDERGSAGRGGGGGGEDGRAPRAGSGGAFLRDLFAPRRQARRAPSPPVLVADEIVALALDEGDLATLIAQGFAVIEEVALPGLAANPRRLRVPPGTTLDAARAAVRALPSGQDADFNHFYRSESGFSADCRGTECPARQSIG